MKTLVHIAISMLFNTESACLSKQNKAKAKYEILITQLQGILQLQYVLVLPKVILLNMGNDWQFVHRGTSH